MAALNSAGLAAFQLHLPLEDLFGGLNNVPQHHLLNHPATATAALPNPETLPHFNIDMYHVQADFLANLQ